MNSLGRLLAMQSMNELGGRVICSTRSSREKSCVHQVRSDDQLTGRAGEQVPAASERDKLDEIQMNVVDFIADLVWLINGREDRKRARNLLSASRRSNPSARALDKPISKAIMRAHKRRP